MKAHVQLGQIGLIGITALQLVTAELSFEPGRVSANKTVIVLDQRQMNSNAINNHVMVNLFTGMATLDILIRAGCFQVRVCFQMVTQCLKDVLHFVLVIIVAARLF